MFTIGKYVNTKKNAREFEEYCKLEGLSSLYLRREVYKLYSIKRNGYYKGIYALVASILRRN